MFETLSQFLEQTGPLAPLVYVSLYVLTALVPIIPTPLVSALGGNLLGALPAIGYGVIGLALGAMVALGIARRLGRPAVIKLVGVNNWREWEHLLGIRSPLLWGVIFFVLNIDMVVMASGLTTLPLWQLWLAAVISRFPWVVLSAWFGQGLLEAENLLMRVILIAVLTGLILYGLRLGLRRYLQQQRLQAKAYAEASPSEDAHEGQSG